jgi:predicted amino acid-binding ACT domain protein
MTYTIEEITRRVRERLGPDATGDMVTSVVRRILELLSAQESELPASTLLESPALGSERIRITASGTSPQGILAVIQKILNAHHCQVLKTSQTVDEESVTVELTAVGPSEQDSIHELQKALEASVQDLTVNISTSYHTGSHPADD